MQSADTSVHFSESPGETPGEPPRDLSPGVRRRAWTEPRPRLWWMLGLGVALITLYVLATKTADWWSERSLLTSGVAVQAVILEAKNDLNHITVPDKQMPPDSECVLEFELNGTKQQVRGQLPEHVERGQHVVTGPKHPVTLHVDPNDPSRWTDRTASPPFLSRQMIGVAIGSPIAVLLALVAIVKRRGVLRVWRQGRAAQVLVIGTGQTPVAPRSRAVKCTPADSTDKRVFTVYLPPGAPGVAEGDLLWVVRPANKPEPCYAAAWFERAAHTVAATATAATAVALVACGAFVLPGCASRPQAAAASEDVCDCCPPAAKEAPMTQPAAPATQPDRITGVLRGGIMAVGSETTGWALETDEGKRIDVDVTKAQDAAASLDGKRVIVTGGMTTANWVERGEKPLLIAERIEAAK